MKINKYIEIVSSATSKLSSMSETSRNAVLKVLSKHYAHVRITLLADMADLEALGARNPDLVFLGMKFIPRSLGLHDSQNIWIGDYLDKHHIPYTGSATHAGMLEFEKPLAKQCIRDAGLATASFFVVSQRLPQAIPPIPLQFPVFIKPTNGGGGLGVDSHSIAHNPLEILRKVQSITTNHQRDSLVEAYLPGREFSVAILRRINTSEYTAMPIELIAPADERGVRLLGSAQKAGNQEEVSEVLDVVLRTKLKTFALAVFHALGARDYGRIDIRLDAHGTPHFLEANLLPSLIEAYGSFPKACILHINLDYESMIIRIAELGFAHTNAPTTALSAWDERANVLKHIRHTPHFDHL